MRMEFLSGFYRRSCASHANGRSIVKHRPIYLQYSYPHPSHCDLSSFLSATTYSQPLRKSCISTRPVSPLLECPRVNEIQSCKRGTKLKAGINDVAEHTIAEYPKDQDLRLYTPQQTPPATHVLLHRTSTTIISRTSVCG
jgi:hypothetical protein